MEFDLDFRRVSFSAGEFSEFTIGPRSGDARGGGLWRAQLGTQWHQQLRAQTLSETSLARFEVPSEGSLVHRGWTFQFTGRIDQWIQGPPEILREIKTISTALPTDEEELRTTYASYFLQLSVYKALHEMARAAELQQNGRTRHELLFIEIGSGLAQPVVLNDFDEACFRAQLERVVEFLEARLQSRARLQGLVFHSPFATLREGQENTLARLQGAIAKTPRVCFEAPTGFGKTGMLLQAGLEHLRTGRVERLVYLTSKATGQLQVSHTLRSMTELTPGSGLQPVGTWLVRPKQEHCVNSVFRCAYLACAYLAGAEQRWQASGLSRLFLVPGEARDIKTLRDAGRSAKICPYDITRAALGFNEVWIGDFNYLFSPSARGLFYDQPGWDPARTLLIIDEAHNLPSRVADNYSQSFSALAAQNVVAALQRIRAHGKLVRAWDSWARFLDGLRPSEALALADEDDAIHLLDTLQKTLQEAPIDSESLDPDITETLWAVPAFLTARAEHDLEMLWWSPKERLLTATCLDAGPAIGATLKTFAVSVLASATFPPPKDWDAACGLSTEETAPVATNAKEKLGSLTKRETKKVFKSLMSGADLLQAAVAREASAFERVVALAPWREGAYDLAIDLRVDTRFQERESHLPTTADTLAQLVDASPVSTPCVVAFFPSYAYAQAASEALASRHPEIPFGLQPRASELASAEAWIDQSLARQRVLFLVLGSSLAESIDLLGGRVSHALVAGPALPEVNAVQRAKLRSGPAGETKEDAFRRVYQVPGMQRVNQALGRLVRAPGQHARVVLHCRRFAETSYQTLLAPEYRGAAHVDTQASWLAWLSR